MSDTGESDFFANEAPQKADKRSYKYKCLEAGCGAVVDDKKWRRHCNSKHVFKSTRHEVVRRNIVEFRVGSGPWELYIPQSAGANVSQAGDCKTAAVNSRTSTITSDSVEPVSAKAELQQSECERQPGISAVSTTAITVGESEEVPVATIPMTEDLQDPAKFANKRLTSPMINTMLSSGPCQPQHHDHAIKTDASRSVQVQPTWYTRKMSDNTTRRRQWLSYSVSAQSMFCVTCMAFGGPTASEMWTSTGCSDWAHIVRDIERHETSADHQKAGISRFQWLSKKRLSDAFGTQRHIWNEHVEWNRRVVSVMIDAIKYLAKEQIALRGHDSCSGKFYNLFALLAQY